MYFLLIHNGILMARNNLFILEYFSKIAKFLAILELFMGIYFILFSWK